MIRCKIVLPLLFAFVFVLGISSEAQANPVFKKWLAAKYPKMKINCNTCHVDKQPKKVRNVFGQMYTKMIGIEDLTATYKSKKGADKKEYEEKILKPAFDKAYEKMKKLTYDDMIKAGLIPGVEKAE